MQPNNPNGIKIALMAFVLNAAITFLVINTFGVIVSGIYLGLNNKGKYTFPLFIILSYFLAIFTTSVTSYPNVSEVIFVNYIASPLLMALIPIGIALITKKIAKK